MKERKMIFMERVVYYARVSTTESGQLESLEKQMEELNSFIAEKEDWVLVDEYIDEGKSGTTSKGRKQYTRLYADLLEDKFDIIVVKDQSRLMRNVLDWYMFIDRLAKNEKKLFYYMENQYYSPEDAILNGVRALVAEQYSRDLSKKINNANKTRMKKGRIVTNGKMWGYNQKDGHLYINEEEAKIVRNIFEMYISGLGFRKIQQELKSRGITNQNGNDFSMTTLKRMIRNEKYMGTAVMNKQHRVFETKKTIDVPKEEWVIIENAVPAIVDKEIFEKANELLKKKSKESNHNGKDKGELYGYWKGSYLYSGKIVCGKCGKPYWHQKYKTMKCDVWQCSSYRNYGKTSEFGCDNPHIYNYALDEIVKEIVYEFWDKKEDAIKNVIEVLDKALQKNGYEDSIKDLSAKKSKIERKKENLMNMRLDGEITKEEFKNQKEKLDNEFNIIDEQINIFEQKNKQIVDKKQRMKEIEKYLNMQITDAESLEDEIIGKCFKT